MRIFFFFQLHHLLLVPTAAVAVVVVISLTLAYARTPARLPAAAGVVVFAA